MTRANVLARVTILLGVVGLIAACSNPADTAQEELAADGGGITKTELSVKPAPDLRLVLFSPLPILMESENNPITLAKVNLGRKLFYDARLSRNHDVSCNTCHPLTKYGVDGLATSVGHLGQVGGRNAPTVYNAAGHIAHFWDGRALDIEDQAKGPPLNPIEMAMPDEAGVVAVLQSIPGYVSLFAEAFPDDEEAISYDNMAQAIGAFERGLVTPTGFDDYLAGDNNALNKSELAGLTAFLDAGCGTCHTGAYVGGEMFQQLGLEKPWDADEDQGRFDVSGKEADRQVFKVPSLRNIAETGPYFHNGSVKTLDEAVRLMADHQLGISLTDEEVLSIIAFLNSLTGDIDMTYIKRPELPESSESTPPPLATPTLTPMPMRDKTPEAVVTVS